MKTQMMITTLALLLTHAAQAEIPAELIDFAGQDRQRQQVTAPPSDALEVVDAVRVDTLYTDHQLVEIAVGNLGFEKEIHVYDHGPMYEFEKRVTVRIGSREDFRLLRANGTYLGQKNGRDHFVFRLNSGHRAKPAPGFDLYVKMGGRQYELKGVRFDR